MNNKISYTIQILMFFAIIFLFIDRQFLKNKSLENFPSFKKSENKLSIFDVSKMLDDGNIIIPANVTIKGSVTIEDKLTVKDEANIGNTIIGK